MTDSALPHHIFLVLLAVTERPLHGYGIRKAVLDRSNGAVEVDPGGLYRILSRLESDGLVEPTSPPEGEDVDARRKYYQATAAGRARSVTEARRLTSLVASLDLAALERGG